MANDVRVFNGNPILPSSKSYVAYNLTSNLSLSWPKTGLQTGNVVADIIDVTPNAAGWRIIMPDAMQVSTGQEATFNNLASNATYQFFVYDNTGSLIANVPAAATGEFSSIRIYLRDNTTPGGLWGLIQEGATAGGPQASQLVGRGLTDDAPSNLLSVNMPSSTKTMNYTVTSADRGSLLIWAGDGAGTFTLPNPSDPEIGNGFYFSINNQSTGGELTILPPSPYTINTLSFFTLGIDESTFIVGNNSNYFTVGDGKDSFYTINRLEVPIAPPGTSTLTLTDLQAANQILEFTGVLTDDVTIIFPTVLNIYYPYNNTTGAFSLSVKTASGTSVAIPQGQRMIFECDGTNMIPIPGSISGLTSSSGTGIKLYNTANTNKVGLLPPATIPSDINWTLPNADGNSLYMLSTNGVNALSFQSPTNIGQATLLTTWTQANAVNATYYNVTNLLDTITTRTVSSKVLVQVSVVVSTDDPAAYINAVLVRSIGISTPVIVGIPASAGSRSRSTASTGSNTPNATTLSFSYLDSPAGVGAYNYQVALALTNTDGTHSIFVNRDVSDSDSPNNFRSLSTVTLTEVIP